MTQKDRAAVWHLFLPNSDPLAVEAAFDALPTAPDAWHDDLKIQIKPGWLRLFWMAPGATGTGYVVALEFKQRGAADRDRTFAFTDCHVASAAPKGQGFGFATLRLVAQLALANGYDRVEIPTATADGLTFWPRQGATVAPEIVAAAGQQLIEHGHRTYTRLPGFRLGQWGELLRDPETQFLLTRVLQTIHRPTDNVCDFTKIPMAFDAAALTAVLERSRRPARPPTATRDLHRNLG